MSDPAVTSVEPTAGRGAWAGQACWLLALALGLSAAALAGCAAVQPGHGHQGRPVARGAAGCPSAAAALVRSAPPSAADPATGAWLGRVDHIRDLAKRSRNPVDRQLAAELDYAGAQVALDGVPPQLAIVPAQETCTAGSPGSQAAPASAAAPARAWLRSKLPQARAGMTAGIVIRAGFGWGACLAASHGSEVAVGGGCEAWSVTLITAAGTLRASCGSIAPYTPCTSATAQPGPRQYFPGVGDELYVPSSGQVTGTADITVIRQPPWDTFSAQAAGA